MATRRAKNASADKAQTETIKAIKGFDPDFKCRDFQYEVGKTYTHDDNRAEAAYLAHQQSLMESGGVDESAYRRDMINAGRGHLIGGA